MLVLERTLLPVLMPLAPAATLARRFPAQLALILKEHGIAAGILNEFLRQAEFWLIEITPHPHQRLCRRHSGQIFDSIGEAIQQLKVMTAIENCRTAALDGHFQAYDDRGHLRIASNFCRNRHCPKCQGAAART